MMEHPVRTEVWIFVNVGYTILMLKIDKGQWLVGQSCKLWTVFCFPVKALEIFVGCHYSSLYQGMYDFTTPVIWRAELRNYFLARPLFLL